MIKRAVIGYLIQWSSHSWYDILFLCNYAAPTAPHVFIASSTHVKLKSSLCTWYLIIACCTTMHNGKMSKATIYSTSSRNRYAAITEYSHAYTQINLNIEYEWQHFPPYQCSVAFCFFFSPSFVNAKGIWHMKPLFAKNKNSKLIIADRCQIFFHTFLSWVSVQFKNIFQAKKNTRD